MPKTVDVKDLQEAVDFMAKYGSVGEVAKLLKVARSTISTRLEIAARRNITPNTDVNPHETKIMSLEQENTVLKDHLGIVNGKLKEYHRDQELFEALCDEIHQVIKPIDPLPQPPPKHDATKHTESLVLHISDEHADQVVEPHRVGGMEQYNFKVALARAERLVENTISVSTSTLSNYQFNELWILAYGDHVNGEIHDSTNHSEFRNAFDNSIAVGQMHALMIRDLAPYFPVIKVLYLSGNHGRRSQKKNYHAPKDNWDYLVARTAEMLCTNIQNVEFLIPDSFSYTFEINGWNFCAFHGDDVKSWNSIPHYGIERKTRRLTAVHSSQGRQLHYFVMGHFHSRAITEHPAGEVIMNGTWRATDEFSYDSLGLVTKPSQLLHGVSKRYGVSFRFPLYMKFDGDTNGPKRYTAPLSTFGHLQKMPKD